jgi:hypothetical protein
MLYAQPDNERMEMGMGLNEDCTLGQILSFPVVN